jgi:hypothetical protein
MPDDDVEDQVQDENIKKLIASNRKQAEELAKQRDEMNAERRSFLLDKVGIPSDGPGALFRDTYAGELSEDAIRSAGDKYGVLGGNQQQQLSSRDEELEALRSVGNTVGNLGTQPNLTEEVRAALLKTNGDPDQVMEIVRQHNLRMDTSESGSERFLNQGFPV